MKPDNSKETSGTPGYMAPEVMCRQSHSYEVDYYALGVILYECLTGKRPYMGKSRREIRDQILSHQAVLKENENWSKEGTEFINRLIQRKPWKRLGFNGLDEVLNHPWMKDFDWEQLEQKKIKAPYLPDIKNVFNYLSCLSEETEDNLDP